MTALAMGISTLAFSIVFFSGNPSQAFDASSTAYQKQTQAFVGVDGANLGTPRDPRYIAAYIVRILLTLVGTLFVLYTIYGGFLMMMSQGDEEKMSKGRDVIRTAVIGLTIILSAYSITLMVAWITTGGQATPMRDLQNRDEQGGEIQFNVELKEDPNDFLQADPFER